MSHRNILTLFITAAIGLTLYVPVMAENISSPAPTKIEQRKAEQAAKSALDQSKKDAIKAMRESDETAKFKELQESRTKAMEARDQAERAVRDARDKINQDTINNNKTQ